MAYFYECLILRMSGGKDFGHIYQADAGIKIVQNLQPF